MFERFQDSARRVLFYARYEASQALSPHIGAEHLLVGLLKETDPIVSRVLEASGVAVASLRADAEQALRTEDSIPSADEIPLNEEAKLCLHAALDEARRLGSDAVEAEHLLLGVAAVLDSAPAKLLRQHGAGLDHLRAQVAAASALRPPKPAAGGLRAPRMQGSIRSLDRITFADGVMDGIACVRDTGLPAGLVVRLVAAGLTAEQIVAEHPVLEREDIPQALIYAAGLCMQAR